MEFVDEHAVQVGITVLTITVILVTVVIRLLR